VACLPRSPVYSWVTLSDAEFPMHNKPLETRNSPSPSVRRCMTLLVIGALLVAASAVSAVSAGPSSARHTRVSAVTLKADGAHALPTPKNYSETCRLVSSWCRPTSGRIPQALRRPLHLPGLGASGSCRTSAGADFDNGQFGGVALGSRPVQPLILGNSGDAKHGVVRFSRRPDGWWYVKTLWFSHSTYQGPIFIRGREVGGTGKIGFGEVPTLFDPQLPPQPTLNGRDGWREWPGATFIRNLGCYAWQIDGSGFSHVVIFRAIKRPV
jgi:hypothetical protein